MGNKRKRAKEGPGSPSAEERWQETVKGWLKERVNREEIEEADVKRFRETNERWRTAIPPMRRLQEIPEKPGGFKHDEWVSFVEQILPGDELWSFCSPKDTWDTLCGRAGYAIVRKGEPVVVYVTVLN